MHLKDASYQRRKLAIILTFLTIPFSGFLTDIYLPSFPSMARSLSVTEQSVQYTLTAFFLSYGFAQLLVGSILDSVGRQKPVVFSLIVLVASSVGIALTQDVSVIIILRIVQGITTAFIVVAKRAFFVDLFEAEERKGYLSYFTIVWSAGPIVAPFLGGYLEELIGWKANFWFLAIYSSVLLIGELTVGGETILEKSRFHLKTITSLYVSMLGNSGFLLGILVLGLSYSVTMVFNIAGPFIVEEHFEFNAVVIGYCTLVLGVAWMLGGIISKQVKSLRFNAKSMIGSMAQVGLVILLVLIGYQYDYLVLLVSFGFLIHICSGYLFTNFFTYNLLFFPKNAGIAGGLMGGLLYVITSLSSFVIASSGDINSTFDMGIRYLMVSVILFLIVLVIIRRPFN